ncbi:hypothetical protein [uncultured Oscillibacter sp.]|uniref:hypothetical protein n=1 Tax=uncultured Oscillibacter sp. TaxID=876091 RepID=UPI0025D6BE6E|nr:hypothetical protein [uncultured Oscillibacter sp.]
MKTRFDYPDTWLPACGIAVPIRAMETTHLLNTAKMLVQKPDRVLSILISDIESTAFSEVVWTAYNQCDRRQSLQNVTSLSSEELVSYVKGTPLFQAMLAELGARGVNIENILQMCDVTN